MVATVLERFRGLMRGASTDGVREKNDRVLLMSAETLTDARRFHARRERQRRRRREALRRQRLGRVREVVDRLAPSYPAIEAVYAFGSLVRPGGFDEASDVDLAVDCADLEVESAFWRALEEELGLAVDLRPCSGPIADAVELTGERLYAREAAPA